MTDELKDRQRSVSGPLGATEPKRARQRTRSPGTVPIPGAVDKDVRLLEIETTHTRGPAPRTDGSMRTVEIWTRNRVYVLDAALQCIEVIDRSEGRAQPEHPFLGRKLAGGQSRNGEDIELSYPFPRPGSEAVFEEGRGPRGQFWQTSTVQRVVLRLHTVTVTPSHVVPAWEEITGSTVLPEHRDPPASK